MIHLRHVLGSRFARCHCRRSIRANHRSSFDRLESRALFSADGFADWDAVALDEAAYDLGHILVRFQDIPRDQDLTEILPGSCLGSGFDLVPGLYQVELAPGTSVVDAVAAYQASPFVVYAQPDYHVRLEYTTNDPSFSDGDLWGLNNLGLSGSTADADIDAPEAWSITMGAPNVIVAVIDSGIDYRHPDLARNLWTNVAEVAGDGLDNDANGYIDDVHGFDFANWDGDPMDDDGHGTHVAGTIAALADNGRGVVGVSPNVQVMALKFLDASGEGYLSDAIAAINYAVSMGAQISNNSWGGGPFDRVLRDTIRNAGDGGHLFIAAAGNDDSDNDALPSYPASYRLENVISVAATNSNDRIASFSNWGATSVDLAAPGVGILSTTPGNTYATFNGTSMATPHVSGVAALLKSADPSLTTNEIKQRLLGGVDPIGQLSANRAKPTLTNGRLNAFNSLKPDLSWIGVSAAGTIEAGQPIAFSGQYRVSGSATGAFEIGYYRSTNAIFGDSDDVLLANQAVVAADGSVGVHQGSGPAFTITEPGHYYVFAALDTAAAVAEFAEDNNASLPIELSVSSVDDLPHNRAPVAIDQSITTSTNTALAGRLAATDLDGDDLTYTLVDAPAHGSVTVSLDGTFAYTPTTDYNGSDSFSFVANDGATDSTPATVSITIVDTFDSPLVKLENTTLVIEGSDGDDVVSVTGIGTGTGVYIVVTQHGTHNITGVTGNIIINLHGGHDRLAIDNAYVNGAIDIDTGDGLDTVILGSQDVVSTRTDLRVDLGTGNDTIEGKRLYIGANQIINGGDGDDRLIFDGFATPEFTLGTSAAGNASWISGNGNDTVHVVYAFIVGALTVDLGSGNDLLSVYGSAASGHVSFFGAGGSDDLVVDTNFFDADLLIDGEEHEDTILLANGLGTELVSINTRAGADRVVVRNQVAERLDIDTGSGSDSVEVRASAFDRFYALLGEDSDELTVYGNLSRFESDFDGALGDADQLFDLGNSFQANYAKRGFELFG